MLNAVYEDDIFADGEASGLAKGKAIGFNNGRIDSLSKFLSKGGTIDDAKQFLDATDEEIQLAQSRGVCISSTSN